MERAKNTLIVLLIILFLPFVLLYIALTCGFDNKYNEMRDSDNMKK